MGKKAEEHYKNHPNDIQPGDRYLSLMSKYNKLKHKFRINSIEGNISIQLLKEQIMADNNIKETCKFMFPELYKKALSESYFINGKTEQKSIRREKIIKSMNLKNNIVLSKKERNPAHYCMGQDCNKYLGHRGFCSEKCHDKFYEVEDDTAI